MVLYFFCPLISQTTCLTDLAHCPKAVAGFHRAVPSTALDKCSQQVRLTRIIADMTCPVKGQFYFSDHGPPHRAYFRFQADAGLIGDNSLHMGNQGQDVLGRCAANVHNEAGVLHGHLGAADPIPL